MHPFTTDAAQSLAALGERRLIAHIREWLATTTAPAPRGIGDDCAALPLLPAGYTLPQSRHYLFRLTTTDSVIFGRHFDATVPPRAVGGKLIKRNLSDIAAMGGTPTDALLSLVCGHDLAVAWVEKFFRGVAETCQRYDVELAGGDCAEAVPGFFCATLALTGFAAKPLLRTGAHPGDTLLVTGDLGGSLAGKHYKFEPRLREGRWLATRSEIRAGMDITDGLAKDLPALLPPGCDARLDIPQIPISEAARRQAKIEAAAAAGKNSSAVLTALARALGDGEDYELLVAADTPTLPTLLAAWEREFPALPLTPIGRIVRAESGGGGHLLDSATKKPFVSDADGYSHFR